MSTKSWLFLQNLSFKLKHDVLPRNHFSFRLQSTLSCFQIVFGDASGYWPTFGKRLFDGDDDIVQSNHMSNLSLICHNGRWGENNKSEHKIVHHTDEIYFTTNKWNTEPQLKGNIKSKYNAFLGSVLKYWTYTESRSVKHK